MKGIFWAVLQEGIDVERLYRCGFPHHVTLLYNVDMADYAELIGQRFNAIVLQHCWNDRIQALRVHIPSVFPCRNENPHISVSWREGVSPMESNEMLQSAHFVEKWRKQESVLCEIEFQPLQQVEQETWLEVYPCDHAKFGDPRWKADRSTPIEWAFRIHQSPGKFGLIRREGFSSKEAAETAGRQEIEKTAMKEEAS